MTGSRSEAAAVAQAARDAAVARCTVTVTGDAHAAALMHAAEAALLAALAATGRRSFSADDVGAELDALGVVRDLSTRRRIVSALITQGAGKRWRRTGWVRSTRRKCAPIALWELLPC